MKLTPNQADLFTASELALLRSKGPWNVTTLVSAIKRTRALRDKQRDLLQRQTIAATRGSAGRSTTLAKPNTRTAAKADLLQRALDGFEAELRELDVQSSAAAKALGKPVAKRLASSAAKRPAKLMAEPSTSARKGAVSAPRSPRVGLERKPARFSVR